MATYSEPIDRVLRAEGLLSRLQPSGILDRELWRQTRDATDLQLTEGRPVGAPAPFVLVRGGLLYALDDLEGSHRLFQDAAGDLSAYWHGMLHRREGDFDNARYWFRRAGPLPFFGALHGRAASDSAQMAKQSSWDPYLFTGECEQARFGADEITGELISLQRAEFDVVFDYTWRQAQIVDRDSRSS